MATKFNAISGTIQRSSYFVLCLAFVFVNRKVQDTHNNSDTGFFLNSRQSPNDSVIIFKLCNLDQFNSYHCISYNARFAESWYRNSDNSAKLFGASCEICPCITRGQEV